MSKRVDKGEPGESRKQIVEAMLEADRLDREPRRSFGNPSWGPAEWSRYEAAQEAMHDHEEWS